MNIRSKRERRELNSLETELSRVKEFGEFVRENPIYIQLMLQDNPLYQAWLKRKERTSLRRRKTFVPERLQGKSTHLTNCAGTYKDLEGRVPKYWRGRIDRKEQEIIRIYERRIKPIVIHRPINSYKALVSVIKTISEGSAKHDHYPNVSGLNRGRLMLAQLLRDRGIEYRSSEVARLSPEEISLYRRELIRQRNSK